MRKIQSPAVNRHVILIITVFDSICCVNKELFGDIKVYVYAIRECSWRCRKPLSGRGRKEARIAYEQREVSNDHIIERLLIFEGKASKSAVKVGVGFSGKYRELTMILCRLLETTNGIANCEKPDVNAQYETWLETHANSVHDGSAGFNSSIVVAVELAEAVAVIAIIAAAYWGQRIVLSAWCCIPRLAARFLVRLRAYHSTQYQG